MKTKEMSVTSDTKKFIQFAVFVLIWAIAGGYIVEARLLPNSFALPFGLFWLVLFLAGVGFIVQGWEGTKLLVGNTLLMWVIAIVIGLSIGYGLLQASDRIL